MANQPEPSWTPAPLDEFPPHIRNHLADRDAALAAQSSSSASPSVPSDSSQPSSTSPFFGFLKIHGRGSAGKDGEKPKRRGPKPDSKPPLTKKQELNRQAQRTHRARKENYVKSLEEEIARLREAFSLMTREKTTMVQENRRLKELLESHGIIYNPDDKEPVYGHGRRQHVPQTATPPPTNYDELGISFVLALEKPCIEHMAPLTTNSVNRFEADFHGHALCISCPPETWTIENPLVDWDSGKALSRIDAADLAKLFNLSNRLQLEGEMTPIAVWATIARHDQFAELEMRDFELVKQDLMGKVKCHGFGAVVEESEVSDALSRMFASKLQMMF